MCLIEFIISKGLCQKIGFKMTTNTNANIKKTVKLIIFDFMNLKKDIFVFSEQIIKDIKYCINIKRPTILMLIKKAVKKDKIIKFLNFISLLKYRSSNNLNEIKVFINQKDINGMSLGLNCA